MKTKHELMAELLVKADWLIENAQLSMLPFSSTSRIEWSDKQEEYTRLRAELAEVKERSAEETYQVQVENLKNKWLQCGRAASLELRHIDSAGIFNWFVENYLPTVRFPKEGSVINPYEPESNEFEAWEKGYGTLYDIIKYLNDSCQFASQSPKMPTEEDIQNHFLELYGLGVTIDPKSMRFKFYCIAIDAVNWLKSKMK